MARPDGGWGLAYHVPRMLAQPLLVLWTGIAELVGAAALAQPFSRALQRVGAVGPGGVRYVDEGTAGWLGLTRGQIEEIAAREEAERRRREELYRRGLPTPALRGRTVILVDDGSVKDETPAICDEYAAQYPTIVKAIHQENGGHGEGVNQGIRNATGLYYKVVDSDDWLDTAALKTVLATLPAPYQSRTVSAERRQMAAEHFQDSLAQIGQPVEVEVSQTTGAGTVTAAVTRMTLRARASSLV